MRPVVLKFGSSVLPTADRIPQLVSEVYRHVRSGRRIVLVVSAFRGRTDELDRVGRRIGDGEGSAHAAILALGELESSTLVAAGLARAGLRVRLIGPAEIGIVGDGDPLDAAPTMVDPAAIRRALAEGRIAVVPGYAVRDARGAAAVLGRGGSDLTAVALGVGLDAEVVLLKDVGWVHEEPPSAETRGSARYESLSYDDALRRAGGAIQPKAVRFARLARHGFRFAAPGATDGTLVGDLATRRTAGDPEERSDHAGPTRIVVLGAGTVGGGVLQRLALEPERFQVVGVGVRSLDGPAAAAAAAIVPDAEIATDPATLLRLEPDILVEVTGDVHTAREVIQQALVRGIAVVSANKALLAVHGRHLDAVAERSGARLLFSAAVGGALPAIELLDAAARTGRVRSVRGVLNGTSGLILERLAAGDPLESAIGEAVRRGLTEADAGADLDGRDAAAKLVLLAARLDLRLSPDEVGREPIGSDTAERIRREGPLRQVAVLEPGPAGSGTAVARVELQPAVDAFPDLAGAENALEITFADGTRRRHVAVGAGRWPTTESVLADIHSIHAERRAAHGSSLVSSLVPPHGA